MPYLRVCDPVTVKYTSSRTIVYVTGLQTIYGLQTAVRYINTLLLKHQARYSIISGQYPRRSQIAVHFKLLQQQELLRQHRHRQQQSFNSGAISNESDGTNVTVSLPSSIIMQL